MATTCPSFLRAAVMRVTRLDSCGRPVYGDCSQVVSDGFVTVQLSAETEEGEEISVTKANGKVCISEAPCEQLRWYTVETEFCQVDPDLVQIMNPTWDKVLDAEGNVIGYNANGSLDCSTGFALEIWMNTYGAADACTGATAQGRWGYMLLPWVTGGAPGDIEIGNDAISFTFSGRTKVGSGWRRGPYPVQIQPNGAPGPLLQPIGPDTHYRLFVSTIRPPEPECGCQPVDRPTPEPAELVITGVTGETPRRTVRLRVDNRGFGPAMVSWGDNTPTTEVQDGATVTHTYAEDGTYTITVADKQSPAVSVTRTVTIPLPPDEPTLELTAADPANPYAVAATVTLPSHSTGHGTLDWGDGTPPQDITMGEDGTLTLTHNYTAAGIYTVTVRRADMGTFRARQAVAVPVAPAPTASVARADAANANRPQVTWDNGTNGPVTVQWDAETPVDGEAAGQLDYGSDMAAGDHTVTVTSKANPASTTTVNFTVPLPADPNTPPTASVARADAANANRPQVTWDNGTNGPVTVQWDAETAVDGEAAGQLDYGSDMAAGDHTVTVTSAANADATTTVNFTVPLPENPATTATGLTVTTRRLTRDSTGYTLIATATGATGSLTVDWGDNATSTAQAKSGKGTATHRYTQAGTYTLTVTDANQRTGTTRVTVPLTA